ncbi:MAG: HAD family hydrolase [Spirochaetia bacterium]|nr:HAD family hydrolase [Spirochaetia bacterium]MBQ3648473.1 HAD family hydrolase [Spirochaetia bacterium]MBQ6674411.1 HAD family hydrolase [Spirochaetia bacterium]
MDYTTIAWDWNGTLLDDAAICMECVNDMLRKRNMPILDLDTYRSYVDNPIIKAYEHIFDLNVVTFDVIVKEFYESYPRYIKDAKLIPGAKDMLDFFNGLGCRQIIVTAAHTSDVVEYLCKFGIKSYFDAVLGSDDFQGGSKIRWAAEYAKSGNLSKGKTLMIGDTAHDAETACAMGADCILFSGGHQIKTKLKATGCPVVHSLLDIPELIGQNRL